MALPKETAAESTSAATTQGTVLPRLSGHDTPHVALGSIVYRHMHDTLTPHAAN